ncbi:MAG: hypothetical protein VXB01_13460 [Opitutae bacterium]|jgi:hypothetical protein
MNYVIQGTRSVGNVSKAERPTKYAKGGQQGKMLVKGCPCITGEMKYGKKSPQKTSKA